MPAYKYTLKDGKTTLWRVKFYITDWTGAKKQVCKRGFKTQREAKEFERLYLDRQRTQSDILFGSLVENYLSDMRHRLKPTTMENKEHIIRTKLLPYFSNIRVCDIDTLKIRKWQNELIGHRDKDGRPYSSTYLKTVNNQLSAILNYAVSHYGLRSNPCHANKATYWTQEQYERFAGTLQKSALKVGFDVLFFTGMREGELLALTPADILPDRRIRISKTYAKIRGEELFLIPKTEKSNRIISIPEFLYNEIMEYIDKLYGIEPGDRIFYFTKHALDKELKRGAEKAGLDPIHVHDLRHSHASLLIHMNFDIKEISERLGHESVRTTWNTYAHLYPDTDTKIAGELNKLRCPGESDTENE